METTGAKIMDLDYLSERVPLRLRQRHTARKSPSMFLSNTFKAYLTTNFNA